MQKQCEVCGETDGKIIVSKMFGRILCKKHYEQMQRNGMIATKTIYDRNDIVKTEQYAEIIIRNSKEKEITKALIDIEDIDKIKDIKWCIKDTGYVVSGNNIILHRFILDCPKEYEVDHINHNVLDNRKCNLRIVTRSQNSMNKDKYSNNTSGYIGVSWVKERNKWNASIMINGKRICLGRFTNIEDAVEARRKAEKKYFGEFAYKGGD